jgi:2-polyprenyl-6-hydroxyphenyl methylase/3-demethylubiquinone-9 3-methyltransferase
MTKNTTVDAVEVAKFAQHATQWWDTEGPLKTLHDINPARLAFIQKFVELPNRSVLDVGCGGGVLSEGLARNGAIVTGLDVEPDAIAAAIAHAKQHKLKIEYVCELIEDYEASSFDFITCMEMLEHVSDPALVIEHCARLLKPGGYLFLSTINRTAKAYASVIVAAEYILRILPRQTHDFDKFLKVSELASIVRSSGLEMVGMSGIAYNPFTRMASLQDSIDVNYLMACRK